MSRFEDLTILGWNVQSPFDCRPREPVRVDVHARSGETTQLQGHILAVAPDTDPEQPQEVQMEVRSEHDGTIRLGATLRPTAAGAWRVRARVRSAQGELLTEERRITVTSSHDEPWERGPFAKQVLAEYWEDAGGELWVGNLASLDAAAELGFDAALNLAEGLDHLVDTRVLEGIDYRYLPLADGGHIAFPHGDAIDGTEWLVRRLREGKKTLVNCRAGIGRSGSLAVLAGAAERPDLGFWDIAGRVKSEKDIYVHVGAEGIVTDPVFHRTFCGADRPQGASPCIERVELVDPAAGDRVHLAPGSTATVHLRVVLEGEGSFYVGLRHDLEGYVRESHPGEPTCSSIDKSERVYTYRCTVGPVIAGERWLTAFAAPLSRAIFDVDAAERRWVGRNVDYDVY